MSRNKKRYVIKHTTTRVRYPFTWFMVSWLLLDRFHASDLVFGIFYSFATVILLAVIYKWASEDQIEVDIKKLLKEYYFHTKQNEEDEVDGAEHPY